MSVLKSLIQCCVVSVRERKKVSERQRQHTFSSKIHKSAEEFSRVLKILSKLAASRANRVTLMFCWYEKPNKEKDFSTYHKCLKNVTKRIIIASIQFNKKAFCNNLRIRYPWTNELATHTTILKTKMSVPLSDGGFLNQSLQRRGGGHKSE